MNSVARTARKTFNPAIFPFKANALGIIQLPCRVMKKFDEHERVFVMVRRNRKILENIRYYRRSTKTFATMLDTGARLSFNKNDVLHESLWKNIKRREKSIKICHDNNRSINVDGTIYLFDNIGGSVESVLVNIVKRLATQVILGCY